MNSKINQIIYLYWNKEIERDQMIQLLGNVSSQDLAECIDDLVNRIPEAMRLVISACYAG